LRDRPEPRIDSRLSSPHFGWTNTPGTKSSMSLSVCAGVFLYSVSGTTSTAPGMRSICRVA